MYLTLKEDKKKLGRRYLESSPLFLTKVWQKHHEEQKRSNVMEKLQTLKLMIQMNKMAFDNNYSLMMNAYEENNFFLYTFFLNQSTDIPGEAKTAIEEWLQGYRKGCENLKKMTDGGYQTVEKSMSSAGK
jgi:hypothetical protein